MNGEKVGLESAAKGAAGAIAVAVSLVYLCGYLALRQQITTLGIPAEFSVFDERYLYAGAGYLVFLAQALAEMGLVALPAAALVVVARLLVLRRRGIWKKGWETPELLPRLECRSKGIALSLAAVAAFGALRSIVAARPWTNLHDLLYATGLDPAVAGVLAGNGAEQYTIFKVHLAVSFVCVLLTAVALWSPLAKGWGIAALAAVAAQFLSLPLLFGALTADRAKPRVRFANGETGLLVWEDKDAWMCLRMEPPAAVLRKPKTPNETVTVTGYARVLCSRTPGEACQ